MSGPGTRTNARSRPGRPGGLLIVWVVLAALLAPGCPQEPPPTAKDVAADLLGYVDALAQWEKREKQVFTALSDVEKTHYVDDDFILRRFREMLPEIGKHRRVLALYEPETEELRQIHERYKLGWEALEDGFEGVIEAVEAKDYKTLAREKNEVVAGRNRLLMAFEKLDRLLVELEPEVDRLRKARAAAQGDAAGDGPADTVGDVRAAHDAAAP